MPAAYWPARPLINTLVCLLLWLVAPCYLLFSLLIVLFVSSHSYSSLQQWYSAHYPTAFDVGVISRRCFTVQWYGWLNAHQGLLIALLLGALLIYLWYMRAIWRFCKGLMLELKQVLGWLARTYTGCSTGQQMGIWTLFGGILLYWVYCFVAYPFSGDETCSYLYFARQGPLLTAISYPLPNNHIFFNLICACLNKPGILSPALVMRLPSMVAGLCLYYGIFCLFEHWGGYFRAMVVIVGVVFCHLLSFYAVQGRGYQLQLLCTVVSVVSCWAWLFSGTWEGRRGYHLFIVSSIIGFYISPLFIYHFLAMLLGCAFLFVKRKEYGMVAAFIKALCQIVVFVLVLYLPLILGSSPTAIVDNEHLQKLSWSVLRAHFGELIYVVDYVLYYGRPAVYLLLAAIVWVGYLYAAKKIKGRFYTYGLTYFVAVMLSFLILTLYKRIYPLERSLCFWVLASNIIWVNVVYDVIRQYFQGRSALLIIAFISMKTVGSVRQLYWDRYSPRNNVDVRQYEAIRKDLVQLSRLHPRTWQIMDDEDVYPLYLRLFLAENDDNSKMVFNGKAALGDVLLLPDTRESSLSLAGYTLWANKKVCVMRDARYLRIYVSTALLRGQ